jgi:hypothetical protein
VPYRLQPYRMRQRERLRRPVLPSAANSVHSGDPARQYRSVMLEKWPAAGRAGRPRPGRRARFDVPLDGVTVLAGGQPKRGARTDSARRRAAAVVGDKIVVVGGRTGTPEQLVSQTEIFDGKAWHDGKDILVPGDHLTAASDRSYLYAVGGRRFISRNDTNAVQRYEPATDQWTRLPSLPKPVSGAGAGIIGGQLLVAGGESTIPAVVSTVLAYDLTASTASWTALPSLTQGRHDLAVAAVGNTLYAIGGSTQPGHTASTNTVGALTFS